jgi:plasmid stabilization system protein ParE
LSYKVEVRGAAELDVAEAMDWYRSKLPGLDAAFLDDFAEVLRRLSETPLIYQVQYRESRRAQLRHFPYLVWFRVADGTVTIRACLRGSVGPRRILQRLR